MNEWMNEWKKERINEWINERKKEKSDRISRGCGEECKKWKWQKSCKKIFLISKVSCAKMSTTPAATALVLASLDNVKQARTIHWHLI